MPITPDDITRQRREPKDVARDILATPLRTNIDDPAQTITFAQFLFNVSAHTRNQADIFAEWRKKEEKGTVREKRAQKLVHTHDQVANNVEALLVQLKIIAGGTYPSGHEEKALLLDFRNFDNALGSIDVQAALGNPDPTVGQTQSPQEGAALSKLNRPIFEKLLHEMDILNNTLGISRER